jgi:hypothetical protein
MNNLILSIRFALSYLLFIFLPFLPLAVDIEDISFLEKFILANIAGLGYGGVYAVIDLVLKIPLTKYLFMTFTLLVMLIVWTGWYKKVLKI